MSRAFLLGLWLALLPRLATPDGLRVELSAERAAAFPVAAAERADEPLRVAVLGRVLDPLPFVQASLAVATAQTATAIADRERARVEALSAHDHNASARDVEAARLAFARARAELADAEARGAGLWGPQALARGDAGDFAARLARGKVSIARLDRADADTLPIAPTGAVVMAPGFEPGERHARILGAAPSVDAALQARGWLVAFDADPLPAGAVLEGWLELAAVAESGVWIPDDAVVWHDGASCVFVAAAPGVFDRRCLELRRAARAGFWIAPGIQPGERFVVSGAQQLLSSQLVAEGEE